MVCLWNPVLKFKSRYPFWTKTSILLKTGIWTFCWTYQSQFEANILHSYVLIRPRKHPSNWKFSKIKLRWWVFKNSLKRVFEKYFFKKTESFLRKLRVFLRFLRVFLRKLRVFLKYLRVFLRKLRVFLRFLRVFLRFLRVFMRILRVFLRKLRVFLRFTESFRMLRVSC